MKTLITAPPAQVLQGSVEDYDLASNLALLRVYSFSPDRTNTRALSAVLVRAMLQLPAHDVSLMLHMIPERLQVGLVFLLQLCTLVQAPQPSGSPALCGTVSLVLHIPSERLRVRSSTDAAGLVKQYCRSAHLQLCLAAHVHGAFCYIADLGIAAWSLPPFHPVSLQLLSSSSLCPAG